MLEAVASGVEYAADKALDVGLYPVTALLEKANLAEGDVAHLPVSLAKPAWLTVTLGTVFGASIRFSEEEGKALLDVEPEKVAQAMQSADEGGKSGVFLRLLQRGIAAVVSTPAAVERLRKRDAHVDLISVSVSGLGLGIPAASTSVYFGYKDK